MLPFVPIVLMIDPPSVASADETIEQDVVRYVSEWTIEDVLVPFMAEQSGSTDEDVSARDRTGVRVGSGLGLIVNTELGDEGKEEIWERTTAVL